jgi:2-phospho-L-lactate guanylyltransferase
VSVRIIVPHRGLAAAKTRLAPVLDDGEREGLARRLLEQVLGVAHEACGDVVVITPSEALEPLVAAAGARLVVQRGLGLNAGLEQARREAIADGVTTLLILHGDLPNLGADDIAALLEALPEGGGVAIAPDRAGTGTNGLALRPPDAIGFGFGVGSLGAHAAKAEEAGVALAEVHRPGLAFDLDTPADLARWIELGDAA